MNKEKLLTLSKWMGVLLLSTIVFVLLFTYAFMPWYVNANEVIVPRVQGLSLENAIDRLDAANLNYFIGDTSYDRNYPIGSIVAQRPLAGRTVKGGRSIYLVVSGGAPQTVVPNVTGKLLSNARFEMEKVGLFIGKVTVDSANENAINTVVSQSSGSGSKIARGSKVDLVIALGKSKGSVEIPSVIGLSLTDASRKIEEVGLSVRRISFRPATNILPNTVLDQIPSSGTKLNPGDGVDLFISQFVEVKEEIPEETPR